VNNAGAGVPIALAEATADRVNAIYAANVVGPTLLAAAAVPHIETTRGSIINIYRVLLGRSLCLDLPITPRAKPHWNK
jgi:NAD(P)-dependent dehydrogenase (short-subunit alcohol dehydrogenase family)